ncbi:MAG TPA: AAA family ATPase [Nocardioidaceae bacterium]|nr:AAA family ATPase [Nocardioidaceae bacterium]
MPAAAGSSPATPPTTPDPDPDLTSEQDHLTASRGALSRMRERTAALDTSAAGDWVSEKYLASALYLRMKALADDPTVPLFFGRLDYSTEGKVVSRRAPQAPPSSTTGERFYIGRRHVSDEIGDPMVVDWRAPVSVPFYRASKAEPMGVRLRRRFGFSHGTLTAYEDEQLLEPLEAEEDYSAILEAEIERPRVGPMRDIVATIQPEQDVIVRSDLSQSVCVQGAPGTGKTAVGLHRAAYLLYSHRDQLSRQGVLVVGPNASFLHYIGDVLPALGEIDAQQTTIEELVAKTLARLNQRYRIRGQDEAGIATLKGDARMATVLHRALWSQVRTPADGLVVRRGSRRWRVATYEVDALLDDLRNRGVRYGAARAMLAQRLAHRVLVRMEDAGDAPDDRVQDAVARSREVKAYVEAAWPATDPARLVMRLLSDPAALALAADGVLSADEQAVLVWAKPPKGPGSAAWSLADAVLVDEAVDLVDRTPSLGHVVADEAQDLSPMMLRAVGRRCSTGSVTVLGDLAQATTPWASRSWEDALGHLGKPDAHVEQLTKGFRVPGDVIDYAARLLPLIAPGLEPPTSVRRARGELEIRRTAPVEPSRLVELVETTLGDIGSVGLIAPDSLVADVSSALAAAGIAHTLLGAEQSEEASLAEFDAKLDVVPASLAKGLEFDHVVLLEPAGIVDGEPDRMTGLRRLYVCLTRAVTSLRILHTADLPPELG